MTDVRKLAWGMLSSPYDDGSPPLISQLMAIRNEQLADLSLKGNLNGNTTNESVQLAHTQDGIQRSAVVALDVDNLRRAAGLSLQSATVGISPSITEAFPCISPFSPNAPQILHGELSPLVVPAKQIRADGFLNSTLSICQRVQATAEFSEGIQTLDPKTAGDVTNSRYPGVVRSDSHHSALYHDTTRAADRTGVIRDGDGVGITSDMIACLSIVDATAGGASVIHRGGHDDAVQNTIVEDDMVLGLSRGERVCSREAVPSTATVGASSNPSAFSVEGHRQYPSHELRAVCDDVDDYPLLSPMDQSKVASPSAADGVAIWERVAHAAGSTSSVRLSPRATGTASVLPSNFLKGPKPYEATSHRVPSDHVTNVLTGKFQAPLEIYADYVGALESRLRDESKKAAALEAQERQQLNVLCPTALHRPSAAEEKLREDFALELYRIKQQLEALRVRHSRDQAHASRPVQNTLPLYGGVPRQERRSPNRTPHRAGSPLNASTVCAPKNISVKVVRDYEDDVIPYPKPRHRQPSPRAPTPAYSSSFVTNSPSPKRKASVRGRSARSAAYSSFDTAYTESFLSESIASFVSEPVD